MPDRSRTNVELIGFAGSLREGSVNRRLLEAAATRAPAGTRLTVFNELPAVPLFNEDVDEATGGGGEGVDRLRRAIRESDGVVIATPEYNQSIPGVLKNAIDWLSLSRPDAVLEGKPVAIMGATSGAWGTRLAQRTLRQILFATESLVMPGPAVYVREVKKLVDSSGELSDPKTLASLEKFLAAFVDWIDRMDGARTTA